jgi:hypothetical protein
MGTKINKIKHKNKLIENIFHQNEQSNEIPLSILNNPNPDFTKSKINKVVWRTGNLNNLFNEDGSLINKKSGGIWFAETKDNVERFARSMRGRGDKIGEPYHIYIENPKIYEDFWYGYLHDIDSGRDKLMQNLITQGYDGIIIENDTWNDTNDPDTEVTSEQYVVFNKKQIKPV